MKRFLSLLVVLALVLSMVPAVFAAEAVELVNVSGQSVTDSSPYEYSFTLETAGTLSIEASGSPAWRYKIVYPDGSTTLNQKVNQDWEVTAGNYTVQVYAYDTTGYCYTSGTVGLKLTFTPVDSGDSAAEAVELVNVSGQSVTDSAPYVHEFTIDGAGTLSVEASGTPAWRYKIYYPDGSSTLNQKANQDWELTEAGTYSVQVYAYDTTGYCYTSGTVGLKLTFTPAEGDSDATVEKAEYEVSETKLAVGDNTVSLLDTAVTTIYEFEPAEAATYTFTAPAGAILGYWGAGSWFLSDPNSTTNTYEWTCTAVGQSAFIGVSGVEGSFNLNVAKGDAYVEVEIPLVVYENKATLSQFALNDEAVLGSYVDVTGEHTAVLGADGFYHLDSADGDILLVDMDYNGIVLSAALNSDRPVMYAYTTDENGDDVKYDIGNAVQAYEAVMDANGYYPLTEDLILFYDVYANGAGTYTFYVTTDYNADTVWMYCMRTVSGLTWTDGEGGDVEAELGTEENPAQLVLDANNEAVVVLEDGWSQYYCFTWTAEKDGVLVLDMGEDNTVVPFGVIATEDYSIYETWTEGNSKEVNVTAGAALSIKIATYDNVAHTYQMYASFVEDKGEVAKIGSVRYMTLAAAVEDAEDGDTITLLRDVTLTEKLTIPAGKSIILDMNGKTLTTADLSGYGVIVNGGLTITGYGTVEITGAYGLATGLTGTLTIENGQFNAADKNDYMIGNWGTTTIEDGTFNGVYCCVNNFDDYTAGSSDGGDLTIKGGTFVTDEYDSTGEYESATILAGENATTAISGGTYTNDVSDYVVDGMVCEDNGDGTYGVNYPAGTESNPIELFLQEGENALGTIAAGETVYYGVYFNGEYNLSVEGGTVDHSSISGWYTYYPMTIAVTNNGSADAEMVLVASVPVGTYGNPAELVMGSNTATIAAGSSSPYFFTWTAEADGVLVLNMPQDSDWSYTIDVGYSYGDEVKSTDADSNPAMVEVAAGDELTIKVATYDPENPYQLPEGTVTFTAAFDVPGSMDSPLLLEIPATLNVSLTGSNEIWYFYTAEEDCTLLLTADPVDAPQIDVYFDEVSDGWGDDYYQGEPWEVSVAAGQTVYFKVSGYEAADVTINVRIPVAGESADNPIYVIDDGSDDNEATYTATVEQVAETTYYAIPRVQNLNMTVSGEGDFVVTYDGVEYASVDGVATISGVSAASMIAPAAFTITGEGSFDLVLIPPVGDMMNPAELNVEDYNGNVATVEAGDQDGYYFIWTAEGDGTLTLEASYENTDGWQLYAYNLTTYDQSETIISTGEVTTVEIAVNEGDQIRVVANTYDAEDQYNVPAGTVTFDATYTATPGTTAENPIWIMDEDESTTYAIEFTANVPAETTYYYAGWGLAGTTLYVYAEDVTIVVDGDELTAVDGAYAYEIPVSMMGGRMPVSVEITNNAEEAASYDLVFFYKDGTAENPVEIDAENVYMGEVADNTNGYYFTYTAERDGTLLVGVDAAWFDGVDYIYDLTYAVNNITTGVSADQQWSDDEDFAPVTVLEVSEGDVIQVIVNTYDPETYMSPAGEVYVAVAYAVAEVDGAYALSVAEALDYAEAGSVVNVLADSVEGGLIIKPGVTLNIHGYTLEAEYLVGLNGSMITGTCPDKNGENGGKLIVDPDSVTLSTTAADGPNAGYKILPVWNEDHYIFTQAAIQKIAFTSGDGTARLEFCPNFTSYVKNNLFKTDGCEDNAVSVIVRVSWMSNGIKVTQEYYYTTPLVIDAMNNSKLFAETVNCDSKDELVFNIAIVTESGVEIASDLYEYNA